MRYTVVADDAAPIDIELAVPASRVERGEQLNWLLGEIEDLLPRTSPSVLWAKTAGGGQLCIVVLESVCHSLRGSSGSQAGAP